MQYLNGQYLYSPSDLITYMDSPFGSAMDRRLLHDPSLQEKMDPKDPLLEHLAKRGHAHEDEFVTKLKAEGRDVVEIGGSNEARAHATLEAMKAGRDVITQAYLTDGEFAGLADFLVRVPGDSSLGGWHYEAWDAKLSQSLKPYFAVQLCCYSQLLEGLQSRLPTDIVVVTGNSEQHRLRLLDYYAYYKSLRAAFLEEQEREIDELPDPALNSEHGRWGNFAKSLLEERDHLSRVANIRQTQIVKLEAAGIVTMAQLASTDLARVPRLNDSIFERLKEQAQLQIRSIGKERPAYEILNPQSDRPLGLAALPPKSSGDLFFDIEGLPTVEGGLEYLWGATFYDENGVRAYRDFWGHDPDAERDAFLEFIDWAYARWKSFPDMHVYHYGAYEITALRKLMGRHGLREQEIDTLLRRHVFVDLYGVVRNGLRLGEPRYSIKYVEHLYRSARDTDVASGGESIAVYEAWRENPDGDDWSSSEVLKSIRDYNIDDCNSTEELVLWLRNEQAVSGIQYSPYQDAGAEDGDDAPDPHADLRHRLGAAISNAEDEALARTLVLLRDSLDFHRRENKPAWWRYYERLDLTELDLHDDAECLVGVIRTARPPFRETRARSDTYEYQFDMDQPFKGHPKGFHVLEREGLKIKTHSYYPRQGILQFRSTKDLPQRMTLIPDEYVNPRPIPTAMLGVIEKVLAAPDDTCAIVDFLKREPPRFSSDQPKYLPVSTDNVLDDTKAAARALENSYLCIQGPPGAGKSYTAKHVICDLLAAGKTIGISSNSHKAINHLLSAVVEVSNIVLSHPTFIKVQSSDDDPIFESRAIEHVTTASKLSVPSGSCVGGTAWTFAHDNCKDKFDYLFIDEAGQVSLANLIAMSRAAKNLILMGDQMQLAQPIQGDHPGESGMSALDYLLQHQPVIDAQKGIFLPQTYRMHPELCQIVSDQVYQGKLGSTPSCAEHVLSDIRGDINKVAGIQFVPVQHANNKQSSLEEAGVIASLVDDILNAKFGLSQSRALSLDDVLIVAPYNAQVSLLRQVLPEGARVGSVDLFQGQEAPVVIVSMCASNAEEIPRGLDFLFSLNRLNVAVSRAQALAFVVANPALANTPVKRLEQMKLVNFFCRLSGQDISVSDISTCRLAYRGYRAAL
ncbi:MAG: TM0106 family RecB-like putative nuclease [Roseovarius sp.]|nr:TM0106 family RecB-like putative nuclease [Roseovarius sp.]